MLDFLKKLLDEGLEAFIKYASGGDTGVYYINEIGRASCRERV